MRVVIMSRGHGINDGVEVPGEFCTRLLVRHQRETGGAQAFRVLFLLPYPAEDRHLCPQGGADLDRHMAEPAESHHAERILPADTPLPERRVRRDTGA